MEQILKNAKGGIHVSEGDIKAAFDFFDVDGKGAITTSSLRKRLGAFHRSLSARVRGSFFKSQRILVCRYFIPNRSNPIQSRLCHKMAFWRFGVLTLLLQEARVLMNDEAELKLEDLRQVLLENEVSNFDPVAEAFKVR